MKNQMQKHDPGQPSIDELISLAEASELSGLSPSQLRHIASKGNIWSKKLGRNWFTTVQALNDYLGQERKPGPKPKIPKQDP